MLRQEQIEEIEKMIRPFEIETERKKFRKIQEAIEERIRIRVNKRKRELSMKIREKEIEELEKKKRLENQERRLTN